MRCILALAGMVGLLGMLVGCLVLMLPWAELSGGEDSLPSDPPVRLVIETSRNPRVVYEVVRVELLPMPAELPTITGKVVSIGTTGSSHRLLWDVASEKSLVRLPKVVCIFDNDPRIAIGDEVEITGTRHGWVPGSGEEIWVGCEVRVVR